MRLQVDVARTPARQARGLMGVRHLDEDSGMAFLFPAPTQTAFWMKDTPIPLSVAFWDRRGRIVGIRDMAPCAAMPCRRYFSPRPYVGAVEANRGYFGRHGIELGDRVRLDGPAACQ